jgi:hypothetical protein
MVKHRSSVQDTSMRTRSSAFGKPGVGRSRRADGLVTRTKACADAPGCPKGYGVRIRDGSKGPLRRVKEPYRSDAAIGDLIHRDRFDWLCFEPCDALMIDHFVSANHSIENLGVQLRQIEPVRRVARRKRGLAGEDGLDPGWAKDPNIVCVFDDKLFKIARIVGIELTLYWE